MRIPTLTRWVALPASAALLALTGCASSGSGGGSAASTRNHAGAQKLIEAAYTTTTAAKSARIAMTFQTPEGSSGDMTITGVEDFANQRTESTASLAGMGTIEQRQIGSDMYIKLPSSLAKQQLNHDATKPWTHIRLGKSPLAAGEASLFGGVGPDPASFVKLLTSVTSSVTAVGTESVRGQQSTHYRMTFDDAKIRKLDAQMGNCGDDEDTSSEANTPLDVWLDGQGRLTRMRVSMDDGSSTPAPSSAPTSTSSLSPSEGAAGSGAMTVEFYDYGVPASIEAPPADQTQSIPDAFGDSSDSSNSCTSVSSSGPAVPHS